MKRIAIIGGGFAGLGAAYALSSRADVVLEIFERSEALGGLAGAFPVGGSHLEQYYHHLFPTHKNLIRLAEKLGIGGKIFFKNAGSANFVNGHVYPFSSALDLLRFPPLSLFERLRLGSGIAYLKMIRNWKRFENVAAAAWLKNFFGDRVYAVMWKPLLAGKFGDYAEKIGMAWFWSRIYERPSTFGYIRGGFKTLTDVLGAHLEDRGVSVRLSADVREIIPQSDGRIGVHAATGSAVFDAVLVAAPPMVFLRMVPDLPRVYAQKLQQLRYYGTVSLVLMLDRQFSPYYWMSIQDPSLPILAVVEHTNFIEPEHYGNNHVLYVAKYLDAESDLYRMAPDALYELYTASLKKINPDFDRSWVKDWKLFRAPATQPIIFTGYAHMKPEIKTPLPNVYFISMSHIYPWDRGMNHGFHIGQEAASLIETEVLSGFSSSAR